MNFFSFKGLLALIVASFSLITYASSIQKELSRLEASSQGRIGVYVINTMNDSVLQYQANQRFPMGCTSKVMGVAAVLRKSMVDASLLSQKVFYTKKDLSNWNPITEKYLSTGMTIADLCAAAISYSDNTAMNLLVRQLGGLAQVNLFARSIHNDSFRQDNDWPQEAMSGGSNPSDSSTPKDMALSLRQLAFGDILAKPLRKLLLTWLKNNTTGNARIRASVPKGWVVADKTGTGYYYGTTNDIGIIWPPHCAPVIIAIYYTSKHKTALKREDIVASVTGIMINELAKNDQCIKLAQSRVKYKILQ